MSIDPPEIIAAKMDADFYKTHPIDFIRDFPLILDEHSRREQVWRKARLALLSERMTRSAPNRFRKGEGVPQMGGLLTDFAAQQAIENGSSHQTFTPDYD